MGDISHDLDVDAPRSNSNVTDSDGEDEEKEQDLDSDSVNEVKNGVDVYKTTLRPRKVLDYTEEVRIRPNWKNSKDPEENHKLHPLDKELQRLKSKAGKGQVKVRVSTLHNAGYGLFAKKSFMEGDELCTYEGNIVPKEAFNTRYANSGYVAKVVRSERKGADGK